MTGPFSEHLKEDLYHCLKCGMCQQVCPTFRVMKQEYFAPRGRVQIIKHYLEGDLRVSPVFQKAVMSCMLCDACGAMCPSGVRIEQVFRNMRREIASVIGPGLKKRALFTALQGGSLMRAGARVAGIGQKLLADTLNVHWKIGNIPLHQLPRFNPWAFRRTVGEKITPRSSRRGRVIYFTGCGTDLVYSDVGMAVADVLVSLGLEVLVPHDQVCCAVPMFLTGFTQEALPNILKNLAVMDQPDVDAIVTDCATCGAAFKKEIPNLLEELGHDPEKAKRVAGKVRDVSQVVCEFMDRIEIVEHAKGEPVKITYHDPCHLVRGMGVASEPRRILRSLPAVSFGEMDGPAECCGGGGAYQFENVTLSAEITSRKRENIQATGARIVATGCPGCRMTLAGNLRDPSVQVLHTIQVLAGKLRQRTNRSARSFADYRK